MANNFLPVQMKSQYDGGYLKSAIVKAAGDIVDVPNGSFCTNTYVLNTDYGYGATGLDPNVFIFAAPAAVTNKAYVFDLAEIPTASDANGNVWRIGMDTTNVTVKASPNPLRFRELAMEDMFEIGDSNFASAPTVNQYGILTVSAMTLTPSATIPATGFTVKVMRKLQLNAGLQRSGDRFLCVVVQL